MEKFVVGLAVGGVLGALVAANSCKMRTLVKKGQEELKQRIDELMDEKLKDMTSSASSASGGASSESGEASSASTEPQA